MERPAPSAILAATVTLPEAYDPATCQRLAREIVARGDARLTLHVLASFSSQLLAPYLRIEADRIGLPLEPRLGPFMQFEQEIEAASAPGIRGRHAVLVLMRPEDVDPDLFRYPRAVDVAARLAALRERLLALCRSLRARTEATLLVANAAPLWRSGDAGDPRSLPHAVAEHNRLLAEEVARVTDTHVFDWAGTVADFGASRFTDARLWALGRVVCGHEASVTVARRIARHLGSLFLPRIKCVVLDLDDTLWGGAIGDDGLEGLALGGDYPGSAYKEFQHRLKALSATGVLLAVASKNDEATVRAAMSDHPEMVLRWEDFSAHRVSWDPKPASLRSIARELNLGLESLAFLDDNPVECEAVRAELPEVTVACLGREPLELASLLDEIPGLDRPPPTEEDAARVRSYADDGKRRALHAESPGDYLAKLGMEARVGLAQATTLQRIAQLVAKTNQLNLTTRRHSPERLRALAESPDARVAWLRLKDVYGDLGLVGVAVLVREPASTWRIDSFLLSCRALGRTAEACLLSYLGELAREAGGERLLGEYVATARNAIARDLYAQNGFTALEPAGEVARWELVLGPGALPWSTVVRRAP